MAEGNKHKKELERLVREIDGKEYSALLYKGDHVEGDKYSYSAENMYYIVIQDENAKEIFREVGIDLEGRKPIDILKGLFASEEVRKAIEEFRKEKAESGKKRCTILTIASLALSIFCVVVGIILCEESVYSRKADVCYVVSNLLFSFSIVFAMVGAICAIVLLCAYIKAAPGKKWKEQHKAFFSRRKLVKIISIIIVCLIVTGIIVCSGLGYHNVPYNCDWNGHIDSDGDFYCDECKEVVEPDCESGKHIDKNDNGVCDFCDTFGHQDPSGDGKCDHCGVIIQKPVCDEHIDADDDGECDVCGTCIEHRDANNDFICDNCGEPMDPPCPPHIDNNGDGICDYCDGCMDHRDLNVDGKCDHCGITMQVCNKHIDADDDGECDRCGACMKHIDKDDDGECDRCGACMEHIDENGDWLCDRCEAELEVVVANNGLVYTVLGNGTLAVSAGEEFKGGVLEVPSEYQGRQVTVIADNGFDNQILLTSISIPEGIDTIGTNAFANCIELSSIEISQSEVRLGDNCFENCPKLQEISYVGTLEQWEMILENSEGNNKVYVNCDGPQDYLPTYIAVFYSGDEEVARVEYKYGSDRIEEPQVPERLGYDGYWEPYDIKASDIEIHAIYTLIEYTIDYEYPDGWTHDNVATYTVEDEVIILSEATRVGYHSLSWRNKSTKEPVSRIVPQEVHRDLTLEAYGDEKPIEYKIKYELNGGTFSNSTPVESVKLEELGEYGNIPLESPEGDVSFNKDGTFTVVSGFNGWHIDSINGEKVTSITYDLLSKYSADGEITLHAGWDVNGPRDYLRVEEDELNENGDYILFGRYPQQLKAENVNIIGKSDKYDEYYEGSDGEYYVKVTASPYESGYTFLNGDKIENGRDYYFKVMPIKWRILQVYKEGDYKAILFAENILANRAYDSSNDGNESKYADSELRAWLNRDFYNAAFTVKDCIDITEVDNSAASTGWPNGNSFATENTEDKVFVLSRQESVNANYRFSTSYTEYDSARRKVVTDYARATGAFMNTDSTYKGCEGTGFYWLRSPYNWYGHNAHFVYFYGSSSNHYNVNTTYFGVVPAITLIL